MKVRFCSSVASLALMLLGASSVHAQWGFLWEAGVPGGPWRDNGSGVEFVQETGTNPPPGDPMSPPENQQADDDYYFAGTYPDPIGTVPQEVAFERAFAGTDNDLRIHFNLPDNLDPANTFRFTFEPFNLHTDGQADPRYGVQIFFNDVEIYQETVFRPEDLGTAVTTAEFSASDVGAIAGAGGDNVIALRGINFNAEGGGNWMGINYHGLEMNPIPEPSSFTLILSALILTPLLALRRKK